MAYKPSKSPLLPQWKKFGGSAAGRWLVTQVVCFTAPYFRTIKPLLEVVEPGRVEVSFKKRWAVTNHIKTVHAIAMCNAAELAGGLCMDVSVHGDFRWIPVGMEVKYLKMAKTNLRAVCKLDKYDWEEDGDRVMPVCVYDTSGEEVFHADITMRMSRKKK